MGSAPDVLVVGAGIVGAACAWRLAREGLTVTVVDPDPARGAWHTAAGMLAPVTELTWTESPLLALNLDSQRRWDGFAADLADEAGRPVGLRGSGTVVAAWDAADLTTLRDLARFAATLGVEAQLLTGRELRVLEPLLSPGLPGGMLAAGDHSVDPRLVHAALLVALERRGAQLVTGTVARLDVREGRVRGAVLADGAVLAAGAVVLAAGAWSGDVDGTGEAATGVRPVKGQTLRLTLPAGSSLARVVRGRVKGNPVYVVPRGDGRVVVGASTEEAGFDVRPRAGAVYELLRDAQALLPELGEASLDEVCTGLRPGSPDNAPLVGPTTVDGLVLATGHYRNGVLLTPVTADGVAALLAHGTLPDVLLPFSPLRGVEVPA